MLSDKAHKVVLSNIHLKRFNSCVIAECVYVCVYGRDSPYNLLDQDCVHRFFIHNWIFLHDLLLINEARDLLPNTLYDLLYDLNV